MLGSCQFRSGNITTDYEPMTATVSGSTMESTQAPEQTGPEVTPSSELYAVTGINEGDSLTIFQDPAGNPIGHIASSGINLRPASNILTIDESNWLQIQYNGQNGWVDYTFLAEQYGTIPEILAQHGRIVLSALKAYRYDQLSEIIHPQLCLRFSPYSYLNSSNLIFCGAELEAAATSEDQLLWGKFDGTGDPINLSFVDYHRKFIYDQDYFHSPIVGFNTEVSSGNSLNNIQEIYPGGMMIEYYYPGFDSQYGGMDWRSIRLVFVQHDANWYLAAVIHGEWTI